MPITALVTRRNIDTVCNVLFVSFLTHDNVQCDAWIFLVGSSGSTITTVCFLYVLWRFPRFIEHVKEQGADPSVVVRLATFYQLNLVRVVFRFLFTVPLLLVAVDGIIAGSHPINRDLFWTDFLTMIAGIGCFISTMITLLIFFPRSIVKESGYKPKLPTVVNSSPKSPAYTPPLPTGIYEVSSRSNFPSQTPAPSGWDEPDDESLYYHDQAPPYAGVQDDAPDHYTSPYRPVIHEQVVYQRQPFPHSLSSPHIPSPGSPPTSPRQMRVALPPRRISRDLQRAGSGAGLGYAPSLNTSTSSVNKRTASPMVPVLEDEGMYGPPASGKGTAVTVSMAEHGAMHRVHASRAHPRSQPQPTLHPYIMSFTSPIDLADIPSRTI
ncbi:hypothetical protein EIP86_008340 [Pleurotus ostreatoroseus]|nr:hypothetical protein EIP86_008340 [Pleurotus ostreatoroseus]